MSRKRLTMEDLKEASATVQKRNPGLFGAVEPQKTEKALPEEKTKKKMNKTEMRCLEILKRHFPNSIIIPQPTRFFNLLGGGTYTPDFLVIAKKANPYFSCAVIEVKGGYKGPGYEHGMERYKRAAAQFHCDGLRFEIATWDSKTQTWQIDKWEDVI
jgi:hypothetical protein